MKIGKTIASSTSCTPRSSRLNRFSSRSFRSRRSTRIFLILECMTLLIENWDGQQIVSRPAIGIVTAFASNDDIVDVLRLKITVTGNFRLQEKGTKAIERDGVAALVIFRELDDRNDHHSSSRNTRVRRRL